MKNNEIKMTLQETTQNHQQYLNTLKEKLERNNITPAKLRAIKKNSTAKRDLTPLTELEMEDVILSLFVETEQQALEIEVLQQQLAENKAQMLVLQEQFQAIRAIVEVQTT